MMTERQTNEHHGSPQHKYDIKSRTLRERANALRQTPTHTSKGRTFTSAHRTQYDKEKDQQTARGAATKWRTPPPQQHRPRSRQAGQAVQAGARTSELVFTAKPPRRSSEEKRSGGRPSQAVRGVRLALHVHQHAAQRRRGLRRQRDGPELCCQHAGPTANHERVGRPGSVGASSEQHRRLQAADKARAAMRSKRTVTCRGTPSDEAGCAPAPPGATDAIITEACLGEPPLPFWAPCTGLPRECVLEPEELECCAKCQKQGSH